MTLLIDNFDSFSYNLYQLIGGFDPNITVLRNNTPLSELLSLNPARVIISPGPGKPSGAGVCEDAIIAFAEKNIPLLGVCLGHQAICEVYGGTVTYARELMHGKTSEISIDTTDPLFAGLPQTITVGRYHSLALDPATTPAALKVTAKTADGEVMAARHRERPVFGLQFHPESILTPQGGFIIKNFLEANF